MRLCIGMIAGVASTWLTATAFAQTPPAGTQPASGHDESVWCRNVRQVTSTEMGLDRSGEAYFSPDGKRISFQAYPRGKSEYQIYIMNVDGSGLKMVSTGAGATTCSFWHPGGEKLIFASNHEDQRPATDVEAYRPRGGEAGGASQPESAPGQRGATASAPSASHGHGRGGSYAWSYYPGMDLYEYTLATGALRRLTTADGYDAECAYSPDGKSIIFSSLRDGPQEIYISDADGGQVRRITTQGGKNGGPFFSPDGKRVCYRSDRVGNDNLQIFINNPQGTAEQAITGHDKFNWCPYWHPSGKWLIFARTEHGKGRPNYDLYLIRDDGSETYRVTSDAAFDGLPVFSNDGKYLMWTSRRGGLESPQIFIAEFTGLSAAGELLVKPAPEK